MHSWLVHLSVLIQAWRKCGRIYANTRIREANYAKVLNPNKSLIASIYTTTTLVWCLWIHRVGPKSGTLPMPKIMEIGLTLDIMLSDF
jgi:hypothetical protein